MKIYIKDVLDSQPVGAIVLVHAPGYGKHFVCEISGPERKDQFLRHLYERIHPYPEVTKMQACKFCDKGLEVWVV